MDPADYYRLPWTLNDNVLGWLEPTKKCNIYCEGCYSTNEHDSHKSLAQVRSDLHVFLSRRRVDSISIAGGDPLTHPQIVDIVRMIRDEFKVKPVVNTNGHAMTPELLHDLKVAGLHGVTFHVDSGQGRPNWKNKDEIDLCTLRLQLAEMVAREGGLSCAFNMTVYAHTAAFVPQLVRWAQEHIDVVHSMVFILFRTARSREFSYHAGPREVAMDEVVYYDQEANPAPMTTPELFSLIRETEPEFEASAYLGGMVDPTSFKWTLVGRVGTPRRIHGYVGKRFMEFVQAGHHFVAGRYLAYSDPALLAHGKAMLAGFSPVDRGVRAAVKDWVKFVTRHPRELACDGCPDMTVHEGQLVWSCRLDELKRHGTFLACRPRDPGMARDLQSPRPTGE